MPDFWRGSAGERQGLSPCLFSFRTATQCQRERFHLPAFRRAVHHLPVAVDEHIMEAHLFSAFSGNSLPERTVLTHAPHCPSGNHCHVRNKPSHRPPGSEAYARRVCRNGDRGNGYHRVQQGLRPADRWHSGYAGCDRSSRLTVQVAVNGTEHPVAAKNGNRAADSHENVSFC